MSTTNYFDFDLGTPPPVPEAVFYGWEDRAFPGAGGDYNNLVFAVAVEPVAAPEPASLAVLGLGLLGAGLARRRSKRTG